MGAMSLLICGASARAAASSARQAGMTPYAVDLFADQDLRAIAGQIEIVAINEFPAGLPVACRKFPPMPWMYVGGLENYPEIVEQISAERHLLGNDAAILRLVRDLSLIEPIAQAAKINVPETRLHIPSGDGPQWWLIKSRKSAGGIQVREINDVKHLRLAPGEYLQRRIRGQACSAAFVADPKNTLLLGFTQQLVGFEFGAPKPFQYAGSIGPMRLPADVVAQFCELGQRLASEFQLRGLFGIDFILDESGAGWLLEINPRFTAGMEVLERSGVIASAVELHYLACVDRLPVESTSNSADRGISGKLVLYSPVAEALPRGWQQRVECGSKVDWADVPIAAGPFQAGEPVVTILCEASTAEEVQQSLLAVRQAWLQVWQSVGS